MPPVQPPQPPQQFPAPAPQPPEQNPYDFFMDPNRTAKPANAGLGKRGWLFLVGALVVVLMIIGILFAVITGGKGDVAPLVAVAQTQQELIRLAGDGSKNARTTTLQNFSVTTTLAIGSAQKDLVAYIAKNGTKLDAKQLALGHNAQTDKALAAAQAANTYDTTFSSTMQSELESYESKLKTAVAAATAKTELNMLRKQYDGAELLRKQLVQQ